ncbi:MAG: GNAT family N-acetyltransferase [Silvanigrellales bacterium]|jgi:hypothetical protein|nr:GNAT family N-acetyltransferase [Silvanigrellales bacterium]
MEHSKSEGSLRPHTAGFGSGSALFASVVRPIDRQVFNAFLDTHGHVLFPHALVFDFGSLLSLQERREAARLEASTPSGARFYFGVFEGNTLVGVQESCQRERGTLCMNVSGVLPENRRRGHYGRLLSAVVALAQARGFQRVTSRHVASNNAVLIAKLKAGFLLSGFEICDEQGLLATLVLHLNESRRTVHAFRTGQAGLPAEWVRTAMPNLLKP